MNNDLYVSEENKQLFRSTLSGWGWEYTELGVGRNFERYTANKNWLYQILRKHPDWDEEKMAINLSDSIVVERIVDYERMKNIIYSISEYSKHTVDYQARAIVEFINSINYNGKCSSEIKCDIMPFQISPHNGEKFMKWFRKIALKEWGIEEERIRCLLTQLGDAVTPVQRKESGWWLSINPVDYLRCSCGSNWSSCFCADVLNTECRNGDAYDGDYLTGTLCYMNDSSTFILYKVDENYKGNTPCMEDKQYRQTSHISNDLLILGRIYPQSKDAGYGGLYRNVAEKLCSIFFNKEVGETELIHLDDSDIAEQYCYYSDNYAGYKDVFYQKTIYLIKNNVDYEKIKIGHSAYCVECGCSLYSSNSFNCCSGRPDEEVRIENRGYYVPRSEAINDYDYVNIGSNGGEHWIDITEPDVIEFDGEYYENDYEARMNGIIFVEEGYYMYEDDTVRCRDDGLIHDIECVYEHSDGYCYTYEEEDEDDEEK